MSIITGILFVFAISKAYKVALLEGSAAKEVPVINKQSKFCILAFLTSSLFKNKSEALCL